MVSSSSYYAALAAGILLAGSSSTSTSSTSLLPGCHAFVPASIGRKSSSVVNRDILKTPAGTLAVPAPSPIAPTNFQHIPTALRANPAGRTPGHDPPEDVQDISETTQTALDKYGIDFTAKAAEGKLDPGTCWFILQRQTYFACRAIITRDWSLAISCVSI